MDRLGINPKPPMPSLFNRINCDECGTLHYDCQPCPTCAEAERERLLRWFKCNPRSVHELLAKFGLGWRGHLPDGVWWGVASDGRCFYWLPPERASQPFEKKLGRLDLDVKGPLEI